MRKRIEFYVDEELIDVREWDLCPHPGMIIDLMDSAANATRTVIVDQVVATGDEDGCKLMLAVTDFSEYYKKFTATGGTERDGWRTEAKEVDSDVDP